MTPRTPGRRTVGHEVANVAKALGFPFMPWQQHWSLVCGELVQDESGVWIPAYPEAFATMMRQQGKTWWEVPTYLHRAVMWQAWDRKPQAIAFAGQSGSLARQKFTKEHWPMIRNSPMGVAVKRPRFAAENAGLDFENGSYMTIWSSGPDSGHSLTIDMAVLDEIWAHKDDRVEQAASPAMQTRRDSQKLLASTAGEEWSAFYLRKQANGRAAVDAGRTEGIAYLEFSADVEAADYDPENPKLWRQIMPALGYTIQERDVQKMLDEMRGEDGDLAEFERAGLNITRRSRRQDSPIPDVLWAKVQDRKLEAPPVGALIFGVDAKPDLTHAAVVAVDDGLRCEVADHRIGVSWLLDFLDGAAARTGARVVVDVGGPVGFLADRLDGRGVEVVRFGTQDVKHSAASFMEQLSSAGFRVRPNAALDAAVKTARKRKIGDGWSWDRYIDGDVSPLSALTLGIGAQLTAPTEAELYVSFD
jgi:hypothetical protein